MDILIRHISVDVMQIRLYRLGHLTRVDLWQGHSYADTDVYVNQETRHWTPSAIDIIEIINNAELKSERCIPVLPMAHTMA